MVKKTVINNNDPMTDSSKYQETVNRNLADLITFLHIFVIVFIIITPFGENQDLIICNIFIIIFILSGWFIHTLGPGDDESNEYRFGRCILTELEYRIRGIDYSEGFIYGLIKPLNSVDDTMLNYFLVAFLSIWLLYNVLILNELKAHDSLFIQ